MPPSFEEKSVWIQLLGILLSIAAYLVVASTLLARGVTALPAYAALFTISVILLVIFLIAGHVIAALTARPEPRDERDRDISRRAESNSSWLLTVGVLTAVIAMTLSIDNVFVAHLLILSLYASEALALSLQILYYRRGA